MSRTSFIASVLLTGMAFANPANANERYLPQPSAYLAVSPREAVHSSNGNLVRSIRGNTCVRTQWGTRGSDPCAPTPVSMPAPPPAPRTTLSTEDSMVYFEFDHYDLTPAARQVLDNVAAILRSAADVKSAEITGHADRIGADAYNMRLSERRAMTVKDYLASRGFLNTDVTKVNWLGEKMPVTNCPRDLSRSKLIACLAPDRYAEIRLHYRENAGNMQTSSAQ